MLKMYVCDIKMKFGGFMSKKQKKLEAEIQVDADKKQDEISEGVVAKEESKAEKKAKEQKDTKKDSKKNNKKKKEKKGGLIKKTKETASELKKVTWPSFGSVVKKTGVVVAFVLLFGIFIFGVNALLGWLVGLLAG